MNRALLSRGIFVSIALLFVSLQLSFGQQTIGKETLGIEYFQQGNYEKALPVFAKLAQSYPDNPMYNYYYGVSLLKNNIFETAAKEALLNSVVDKTPVNSNFYLANYFHALGNWQEAKDFYDRYRKVGSKQEKKSLQYEYYVNLCEQKINPFKPQKLPDTGLFGDTLMKPPPKIDEKIFPIPEALKKAWFNFQVSEVLAYHSIDDFRSEASKILFTKAWICTGKNDSILVLTDSLRKVHASINRVDTRLGMVQQIVDCEQKSYQLMRDREKFLDQSRVKESAYWEREGPKAAVAYNSSIQAKEDKLKDNKKKAENLVKEIAAAEAKKDSMHNEEMRSSLAVVNEAAQIEQAENTTFKVQIGSFKNGITTTVFKKAYAKISKLRKIDKYTDPKKFVVYTVGNFTNLADASTLKDQLIKEGMKGAFVATFSKSTDQPVKVLPASVLNKEKEQEQKIVEKPVNPVGDKNNKSAAVENLIFKVQIGSFKNGLVSAAFKKSYARISKSTKVEKYSDSKQFDIYTVGNFAKYADASKMKDQIVAGGIKDAFVAAYLNGQRIKVSEALKLAGGK